MIKLKEYVLSTGYLNDPLIFKRETLYTGMNGRKVERFFVSTSESYVFKPLTNPGQQGRERLIYDQVLPAIDLPTPKVVAVSETDDPKKSWMIFEDLSPLEHRFDEKVVTKMASLMATWHTYPIQDLGDFPLKGPKPSIEKMIKTLSHQSTSLINGRVPLHVPRHVVDQVLRYRDASFSVSPVFSHGDLHLGNYALSRERLVVLDWEHAHINLPFWDLYHLLDLSHPLFPKQVTPSLRDAVLEMYLEESQLNGRIYQKERFKHDYYVFAAIFSMWMLLLIKGDLAAPNKKWPKEQLKAQWEETLTSFIQCAEALS